MIDLLNYKKDNIDDNLLVLEILKQRRYDLLDSNDITIHIDDSESSSKMIELLFEDDGDVIWHLIQSGYFNSIFKNDDIKKIFLNIIKRKPTNYVYI